jgi:hypothetical protein
VLLDDLAVLVEAVVAHRGTLACGLGTLAWQTGYGAFSVRRGDVPRVLDYLREQPRHHAEGTLLEALEETPPDTA